MTPKMLKVMALYQLRLLNVKIYEISIILLVFKTTIYTFIELKRTVVRTKREVRSAKELRIKAGALILVMLKGLSRLALKHALDVKGNCH